MDQTKQATQEHLPDENYIERLFPKCPPKQKAGGKRSLRGANQQQRKQTKLKVHQHSRRELEARRNKIKSSASTSMIAAVNNLSSESSDEHQTTPANRISSKNIKNNLSHSSTTANIQYASSGHQKKPSSTVTNLTGVTNNTAAVATPTNPTTLTNHSRSPTSHRRSGKYTASQNLLQQLKRSQSGHQYNNNNNNNNNNNKNITNNSHHDITTLAEEPLAAAPINKAPVDIAQGPIKDLEVGLNKISLTISCDQEELCDSNYSRQDSSSTENLKLALAQPSSQQLDEQTPQPIQDDKISAFFGLEQGDSQTIVKNQDQAQDRIITLPTCTKPSAMKQASVTPATASPSLRHHSLPNEISHYSIVRANNVSTLNNSDNNPLPIRKLSVRFNDLSDKESGTEELTLNQQQPQKQQHRLESELSSLRDPSITNGIEASNTLISNESTNDYQHSPRNSSRTQLSETSITLMNEQKEAFQVYEADEIVTKDLTPSEPSKFSSTLVACDQEVLCDVGYTRDESPPSNENLKHQFSTQQPALSTQQVQQVSPQLQDEQPPQEQQQQQQQLQQQQTQTQVKENSNYYDLEQNETQLTSHISTNSPALDMDLSSPTKCEITTSKPVLGPTLNTTTTTNNPEVRNEKLSSGEADIPSLIVKNTNTISNNSINNNINIPPRSSSIRFNTLSDNESGPDEPSSLTNVQNSMTGLQSRGYTTLKKCDTSSTQQSSGSIGNRVTIPGNSFAVLKNIDEDAMPTTKTALIFPRLDEGLSSEAESNEDEIDEEDERAMDADVDADDDEEEEDDDEDADDDLDNDNVQLDRVVSSSHISQTSVDGFIRQQQQLSNNKPQNRSIGSIQQQQQQQQHISSMMCMTADATELNQVKVPGMAYGGYTQGQASIIDHNDLKSMTNYPNSQNGGQPNYWMGGKTNQIANMSTQPTSSQSFSQRNHTNDNNSFNNNEAPKVTTSRPSSDTDNETDRLLGHQRNDHLNKLNSNNSNNINNTTDSQPVSNAIKQNSNSREVLIEGVLFNVRYLGSTHSDCEARSDKEDRIHQAEMAVHEVKFRNGLSQSALDVQLFISTEKIMVLDDKHRKIMMDHSIKTISYIADIGDAIVLFVRKKSNSNETTSEMGRPVSKVSCHVFESSESHTITKSISQAFQVAYTEMLKATGTGDTSTYLPKELDYQEVLNSQEMSTDELEMFARKENEREIIVPKLKGEILGLSIVESGWGSVLPAFVIANLKHDGPAYRCKRLSIGDQILSVNGNSLVGLPLAECQEILRKTKNQRVARLLVVPCPITVEVKIKRPDVKYQLGFSVQNGVICSLLRGGIAERGGVRVGHRIMSINGTTVVGVPHEKIVTLLASSVGEIQMKTCLTSLYRLILGEEKPVHF